MRRSVQIVAGDRRPCKAQCLLGVELTFLVMVLLELEFYASLQIGGFHCREYGGNTVTNTEYGDSASFAAVIAINLPQATRDPAR
jgi:hypothetical protein